MATPFADIQSRIASATTRHLADATADFGGGVLVDGLYRDPYAEAFGGMVSGSNPSFEALSGALSGIARGAAVSIKGKAYTVVRIDPAREGMTLMELEQQ